MRSTLRISLNIFVFILQLVLISLLISSQSGAKFFIACNSIIARSHGVAEPVYVQLIKSFCLPLLVYYIGAVKLKASTVQQLSVCWNDVFRRIFLFKKNKSVRILQVSFGTLDFKHL